MSVHPVGPIDPTRALVASSADSVQLVVCVLGDERYGLEVEHVNEIIRLPPITMLPKSGPTVRGVMNLRGRIVPIVDLRQRFDLPIAAATKRSRIVVADAGGVNVGFVVDAVDEVIRIDRSAIEPPPELATRSGSEHVTGIARTAGGLIVMLNLERLVAWDVAGGAAMMTGKSASVG